MSATTPLSPARWVVQTKLRPPRLREDFVSRPRLMDELHAALMSRPLTLVSAPAGYGKTTLLAALPREFPHLPVAWLSLDGEDNDPAGFLAALVAALGRMAPGCADTAQTLLESLPDPGAQLRRVVGVLINDISEALTEPFVVVLDDLHVIEEPAVYTALEHLIERMPEQMHLAVAARYDPPLPLARLRARGYLAELRPADLRFTRDEAAVLLNERLRLGLSAEDLAALQDHTEGWVAGLRLLVGPLDRVPAAERAEFISRSIRVNRHVLDLLSEEVLTRQEPEVREFLLQTSILEELTPALCQAVTGRQDAGRMLEEVYRRNLFTVAVDGAEQRGDSGGRRDREPAYRYHDLFGEFLRGRLAREKPQELRELHRRAAGAQTDPGRAVHHYLEAGMWLEAARVIEQVGLDLLYAGMLSRLRGWISALPQEVREGRPWLAYLLGATAVRQGDFATARPLLERAKRGFEEAGDRAGRIEALLELARVTNSKLKGSHWEEIWPEIDAGLVPPRRRAIAHILRAWINANHRSRWTAVEPQVEAAIDITLKSGNSGAFNVLAIHLRAPFLMSPSGTATIERYCHSTLARFGNGTNVMHAGSLSLLSHIHMLRGEIEEAERAAHRAREIGERLGGIPEVDTEIDQLLLACALIRADYAAFDGLWHTRLSLIERHDILQLWLGGFLYTVGKALCMQGRLLEARQLYSRLKTVEAPPNYARAGTAPTIMEALLATADRRYKTAEHRLLQVLEMCPDPLYYGELFWIGYPRLLLAHLYYQWSRPRDALMHLQRVLASCERQGTPGLILREGAAMVPLLRLALKSDVHATFVNNLLEVLGGSDVIRPVEVPTTGETLTPREVEVLRLIAEGATNREIARRLFVSERTVKSHITSILRKVGVSSRTQAAARARELRLI